MIEENKMSEVVDEIKGASEEELNKVIEGWYAKTRIDGMHLGAYMISAAVMGAINKNLKDGMNSSHRDFKRAIQRVMEIVSVQLQQEDTPQNDYETTEGVEEV